ncbi:MAG: hypothetical protein A2603_14535 [Bdellovibrionales bacterium RIFOXYD1_FULL_55_31]|nr:MAG: hypothetical protein A2603_14535 [Bdellovibrionales bacterium RIFOXYD1_FULL_55_31]
MRKGEKTRATIIKVATRLFSEKGVYRVTIPEVAKGVGLSHAALYRYFSDQDALFLACVERAVEEGRAALDESVNPNAPGDKRLRCYIEGNVEWFSTQHSSAALLLAVFYFSSHNAAIAEFHATFVAASLKRLETHIIQGAREGAWPMQNSIGKARQIHNLMVGEMIKTLATPYEMTPKDRSALLWKAVLRVIR